MYVFYLMGDTLLTNIRHIYIYNIVNLYMTFIFIFFIWPSSYFFYMWIIIIHSFFFIITSNMVSELFFSDGLFCCLFFFFSFFLFLWFFSTQFFNGCTTFTSFFNPNHTQANRWFFFFWFGNNKYLPLFAGSTLCTSWTVTVCRRSFSKLQIENPPPTLHIYTIINKTNY